MKMSPKRRASALCCSASKRWSRKKITQWSRRARRIPATVASSSSRPKSTPCTSAPSAPLIGRTSRPLVPMVASADILPHTVEPERLAVAGQALEGLGPEADQRRTATAVGGAAQHDDPRAPHVAAGGLAGSQQRGLAGARRADRPAADPGMGLRVAGVALPLLLDPVHPSAERSIGRRILLADDFDGRANGIALTLQQLHVDVDPAGGDRIEPGEGTQPSP